jgi:ABC-2 type transport system permease protein
MNTYVWLFRREFWENRSIVWLPAAIGVVVLLLALFSHADLSDMPANVTAEQGRMMGAVALLLPGAVFFAVMSIYTAWYLLDCLHSDRRDKSILFWKSLPISDTETVISKLLMGSVVIPLVYFIVADIAALGAAFVLSVRLGSPLVTHLWHLDTWFQLQLLWIYIIVTQALWFLPLTGWLMLVSAWARKAPALWSILPPLALVYLEREIAHTFVLGNLMWDRVAGYLPRAFNGGSGGAYSFHTHIDKSDINAPTNVWELINPQAFFSSAALWGGVAVGAALVAAAIVLRHRRSEA